MARAKGENRKFHNFHKIFTKNTRAPRVSITLSHISNLISQCNTRIMNFRKNTEYLFY